MLGLTFASTRSRRIFRPMFATIAKCTRPWSERPSLRTAFIFVQSQRLWRNSFELTRPSIVLSLAFELTGRLIRKEPLQRCRHGECLKNVLELELQTTVQ